MATSVTKTATTAKGSTITITITRGWDEVDTYINADGYKIPSKKRILREHEDVKTTLNGRTFSGKVYPLGDGDNWIRARVSDAEGVISGSKMVALKAETFRDVMPVYERLYAEAEAEAEEDAGWKAYLESRKREEAAEERYAAHCKMMHDVMTLGE